RGAAGAAELGGQGHEDATPRPRRPASGVMDYRRFLGQSQETTAPVVNGQVWLSDRRLRILSEDGWCRVKITGRSGEELRAATEEEVTAALGRLSVVRGPFWHAGLVRESAYQPVELKRGDEDPPLFSPLKARAFGDLLLWDELEWESEIDEVVRRK